MRAPSEFNQHALDRFIERWWPLERNTQGHFHPAELERREDYFRLVVRTLAFWIEDVPDERQQIWGWIMSEGPYAGFMGMLVVAEDGTVRTTLPPGTRRRS